MRLMFVTQSALLLLLSGAFSAAQAMSAGPDSARVSSIGLLGQFSPHRIERPSAMLLSYSDLGAPFSMGDIYPLSGPHSYAAAVDGLLATLAGDQASAGLPREGGVLTGQSSPASAPSAVPLPTTIWLFASAVLGFVAVARRRKV